MTARNKNIPALRFKEFKEEWKRKELKDLTKINQGLQIPISERYTEKVENSFFYITNEFLKDGAKRSYYIKNPPTSVICDINDLLMTRTGNTGQVVTGVHGAFHNNFFKIKMDSNCEKWFLFHFLTSYRTQHTILKLAGTSTIPDLNHGDFYKIRINIPSLLEQQKIASFLSAIDEKIRQLTRRKELLEQYKKGVMQQLFSGKLRFKDKQGKAYPKWEEKKLGDIGDTFNGLAGKTKENFGEGKPYIQYKQIFDNYKIDIEKCGYVQIEKGENQQRVKYGDVFFTTSSETPNEVGFASVLLEHVGEMYLNSFCFGYRPNSLEKLTPQFAQYLFRNELFRRIIIKLAQGSTRYNMSKGEFMKLNISLPSKAEQQKIASFLSSIDTKIESVSAQIEGTKGYKKGLLQQMFV